MQTPHENRWTLHSQGVLVGKSYIDGSSKKMKGINERRLKKGRERLIILQEEKRKTESPPPKQILEPNNQVLNWNSNDTSCQTGIFLISKIIRLLIKYKY